MNDFLPDVPQRYADMAEQVLKILASEIHWFTLPKSNDAMEIKRRRWGHAFQARNVTTGEVQQALLSYLSNRWGKDPMPEPRDILEHLPKNNSDTVGGQIRRFIQSANRYEINTAALYWFHWQGVNRGLPEEMPDGLPEILEQAGYPELAEINRHSRYEICERPDEIRDKLKGMTHES